MSKFTMAWDCLLNFWDPFCLPMLSHPYLPFVTDCKNKKLCFQPSFQPTNVQGKIAGGDDKSSNRGMVSVKQTRAVVGLLTFVTAFQREQEMHCFMVVMLLNVTVHCVCSLGMEVAFQRQCCREA